MSKKEKKQKSQKESYSANSIRELHYPDNVRHRPGMYIGGIDENGAYRAAKEIIDNSIDEALAGHGKRIVIILDKTGTMVTVIDHGRGVPMEKNKDGKYASEVVFATLHGSGKFDTKSYKGGVVGLHGVGAAVTNALSEELSVWAKSKNGDWRVQDFQRGVKVNSPHKEFPKAHKEFLGNTGTVVSFKLDAKIFGKHAIDPNRLHREMKNIAMLNPGVEIVVIVAGKKTSYKSDNGLLDMIYDKEQAELTLFKPFHYRKDGVIDVAVSWQDDADTVVHSYVNSSHTQDEGTHVNGARAAIIEALRESMPKSQKPTKGKGKASAKDDTLDNKHLFKGMRLALNFRMEDPVYDGQTKDRLTSTQATSVVKQAMLSEFSAYLKKHPKVVTSIVERAKKFQKIDDKFQSELKGVKSIKLANPNARGLLPGKLIQANNVRPEDRELMLVEGDSAGGTAGKARYAYQEILALRGKILNAAREDFSKLLNNQEIQDIVTAIGTELGPNCKTTGGKIRVGRITILTDADQDGKHICSLLLTFFVMFMRPWVEEGKIAFVNLPLYVGKHGETRHFGYTREEMLSKFPEAKRKNVLVTRMKGLAEASDSELREIGMNPETRKICKLSLNDHDVAEVLKIMQEDTAYRKEFLGIKDFVGMEEKANEKGRSKNNKPKDEDNKDSKSDKKKKKAEEQVTLNIKKKTHTKVEGKSSEKSKGKKTILKVGKSR